MQTSYDEGADAPSIADSEAWQALVDHVDHIKRTHLKNLLIDEGRTDVLTMESDGIYADFSRQRVTKETLDVRPYPARHNVPLNVFSLLC
jgi:hypothetical protein